MVYIRERVHVLSSSQVGWYNNQVQDVFALDYPEHTLAIIVISTPAMFEKCFIPFLKSDPQSSNAVQDPIDRCIGQKIKSLTEVWAT